MATNETDLVWEIRKSIQSTYPEAVVWKIHGGPMQEVGIPDLICCIEGRLIGLEVKFKHPYESEEHARSRVTPGQDVQIARILRAGGTAGVVLSAGEALELIAQALGEKEK